MCETVILSNLMMMTSVVCDESLARHRNTDRHTDTQAHRNGIVCIIFSKSLRTLKTRKETCKCHQSHCPQCHICTCPWRERERERERDREREGGRGEGGGRQTEPETVTEKHWDGGTDRDTETDTSRSSDKQTGRKTGRQTGTQAGMETVCWRHTERQTDRQTDRQRDRQTDRQRGWLGVPRDVICQICEARLKDELFPLLWSPFY